MYISLARQFRCLSKTILIHVQPHTTPACRYQSHTHISEAGRYQTSIFSHQVAWSVKVEEAASFVRHALLALVKLKTFPSYTNKIIQIDGPRGHKPAPYRFSWRAYSKPVGKDSWLQPNGVYKMYTTAPRFNANCVRCDFDYYLNICGLKRVGETKLLTYMSVSFVG